MKQKAPIIRYVVLVACICVSGGLLLHTSQLVQHKEAELKRFKSALEREKQMVGVLEAEWAQLNSPSRLEDLVQDHLNLQMPDTESIAPNFEDFPEARDAFVLDDVESANDDLRVDIVAPSGTVTPERKPRTIPMKAPTQPSASQKSSPQDNKNDDGNEGSMSDLLNRLNKSGGAP